MVNICFARLTLMPSGSDGSISYDETIPAWLKLSARLENETAAGDCLVLDCEFRWVPPFDELCALSAEKRLSIRCTYEEPGVGFMGAWRVRDGAVEQDDYLEY